MLDARRRGDDQHAATVRPKRLAVRAVEDDLLEAGLAQRGGELRQGLLSQRESDSSDAAGADDDALGTRTALEEIQVDPVDDQVVAAFGERHEARAASSQGSSCHSTADRLGALR